MIVKLLTEHYLEFLSLKGGCRGSSESTLVKMSYCMKYHALAQILSEIRLMPEKQPLFPLMKANYRLRGVHINSQVNIFTSTTRRNQRAA